MESKPCPFCGSKRLLQGTSVQCRECNANVYLVCGRYKVAVVRRPLVLGGWFETLEEAIANRDCIEATSAKRKIANPTPKSIQAAAVRARFKAAGLCACCGLQKPAAGRVTCQGCLDTIRLKRWAKEGK